MHFYISLSLNKGWIEPELLALDPYFEYLRDYSKERWENILKTAYSKEAEYELTITNPQLRKQINSLTIKDQNLRYKRVQAKNAAERKSIDKEILKSDQEIWRKPKRY